MVRPRRARTGGRGPAVLPAVRRRQRRRLPRLARPRAGRHPGLPAGTARPRRPHRRTARHPAAAARRRAGRRARAPSGPALRGVRAQHGRPARLRTDQDPAPPRTPAARPPVRVRDRRPRHRAHPPADPPGGRRRHLGGTAPAGRHPQRHARRRGTDGPDAAHAQGRLLGAGDVRIPPGAAAAGAADRLRRHRRPARAGAAPGRLARPVRGRRPAARPARRPLLRPPRRRRTHGRHRRSARRPGPRRRPADTRRVRGTAAVTPRPVTAGAGRLPPGGVPTGRAAGATLCAAVLLSLLPHRDRCRPQESPARYVPPMEDS